MTAAMADDKNESDPKQIPAETVNSNFFYFMIDAETGSANEWAAKLNYAKQMENNDGQFSTNRFDIISVPFERRTSTQMAWSILFIDWLNLYK